MFKRFSDRMGITQPTLEIFVDSMPDPLKNSLWNFIYETYLEYTYHMNDFFRFIFKDFLNLRIDEVRTVDLQQFKGFFFSIKWYEVYNFIEFLVNNHSSIQKKSFISRSLTKKVLIKAFNDIFERQHSGFRFVDGTIVPITNPLELEAISDALETFQKQGFEGASTHIKKALTLFSKRPSPDYTNAIKEAISAVESVAKIIADKPSSTLGEALKTLTLHPALEKGFMAIYGYTNDDDGIRHSMINEPQSADFEEAKYMIVSCSAFCHYLISKAQKAG